MTSSISFSGDFTEKHPRISAVFAVAGVLMTGGIFAKEVVSCHEFRNDPIAVNNAHYQYAAYETPYQTTTRFPLTNKVINLECNL